MVLCAGERAFMLFRLQRIFFFTSKLYSCKRAGTSRAANNVSVLSYSS